MMTTGNQLRAARALVDMDQGTLAERAGININTVSSMEKQGAATLTSGLDKVKLVMSVLEAEGVEFLNHNEPGVKLRLRYYKVISTKADQNYWPLATFLNRQSAVEVFNLKYSPDIGQKLYIKEGDDTLRNSDYILEERDHENGPPRHIQLYTKSHVEKGGPDVPPDFAPEGFQTYVPGQPRPSTKVRR
jgi:DNA-binding XRE family transcriptional regulator